MMFDGFANVWTPVMLHRKIGARPVRTVLAGVPLVLFRGKGGRLGALIDRCPHRGVALSLGRVTDDGCLECPFHGWRFDPCGENHHVPLNPDAKTARLGAQALPIRQIGDLVWVYTAAGAEHVPEPSVPAGLADPGLARCYVERLWACHWTRAMENMLDSPHLPFVHRRTIGGSMRARMTARSRLEVEWEDRPWGGVSRANLDGERNEAFLEFHRPNMMSLHIPIPGKILGIHALVIPADTGATRLLVVGSRSFLRWPILGPLFGRLNGAIAAEDRAVVESSGPDEVPPPGEEPSVATDRATLQFRKYYYETLRPSRMGGGATG